LLRDELGTKWQILDKRLLLSAALFRTDIENEVAANDDGPVRWISLSAV
jgi:catecholate siderophore receptor